MSISDILIRLFLAVLIGGAIGYEREFKNRPAGFRTHILVCVGATVVSLIQSHMAETAMNNILLHPELSNVIKVDYARLGAQVITGVGFLGAGTILHDRGSIKGLTTAASIWVVACVGLAIGMGYYVIAILSGVCIVLVLGALKKFQNKFIIQPNLVKLQVSYDDKKEALEYIDDYLMRKGIKIKNIEFYIKDNDEENDYIDSCLYTIEIPRSIKISNLISRLSRSNTIFSIEIIED
ncbi:MgtC/SapB family protein [Clostridium sp. Ade.TY]|uniref:MgtC/SapB family protein n=1 Tax=Clostridium sp. Ade.TY TaxID=1391647 RepID=UPI000420C1CF|nr:MgtC/SapB family protein [Clostridium sp. Ade.TY]